MTAILTTLTLCLAAAQAEPHSLFVDTMRSLRSLVLAHHLGHRLLGENDRSISLLERAVQHAATTAACNVYYGDGRDIYDIRGRVAHESLFNVTDGNYLDIRVTQKRPHVVGAHPADAN